MDKVRLFRDIARVKKQMFAMVSLAGFLAVGTATIIGHGFNFVFLFRNSIIAIIAFGGLAYVCGILYEKIVEAPLIDSYRAEAKQRIDELKTMGSQRMAMRVGVSELTPNMKVIDPIYSKEGALLVRGGASLTERLIKIIKDNNIQQVSVEAKRTIPSESD
ncbi:MAG: hypothetical protein AB1656_03900 [Candidatus Omnitrophota bacterium]